MSSFPQETTFESEELYDSLSRILIFLKPYNPKQAMDKVFDALKPGGKVLIINATPFSERWLRVKELYDTFRKANPTAFSYRRYWSSYSCFEGIFSCTYFASFWTLFLCLHF